MNSGFGSTLPPSSRRSDGSPQSARAHSSRHSNGRLTFPALGGSNVSEVINVSASHSGSISMTPAALQFMPSPPSTSPRQPVQFASNFQTIAKLFNRESGDEAFAAPPEVVSVLSQQIEMLRRKLQQTHKQLLSTQTAFTAEQAKTFTMQAQINGMREHSKDSEQEIAALTESVHRLECEATTRDRRLNAVENERRELARERDDLRAKLIVKTPSAVGSGELGASLRDFSANEIASSSSITFLTKCHRCGLGEKTLDHTAVQTDLTLASPIALQSQTPDQLPAPASPTTAVAVPPTPPVQPKPVSQGGKRLRGRSRGSTGT